MNEEIREDMGGQFTLPALLGPTATGKTEAAIALAGTWGGEIISADSIQVYKALDIGSAKPTQEERRTIPHHMMDVLSPMAKYSVAQYQKDAYAAINSICARARIPFIVGGTGLYVMALEGGLQFGGTASDPDFREMWQRREEDMPGSAHQELAKIDPAGAKRLHPNDSKRVIRAIEIIMHTGLTLAEHEKRQREVPKPYRLVKAALTMPRELLYKRIDARVDGMLSAGLKDEVAGLLKNGVDPSSTAMQGLGYKEMVAYLQGTLSWEEAVDAIKRGTRHLAKRQWTWFRRDGDVTWFDVTAYPDKKALFKALGDYYESGGVAIMTGKTKE